MKNVNMSRMEKQKSNARSSKVVRAGMWAVIKPFFFAKRVSMYQRDTERHTLTFNDPPLTELSLGDTRMPACDTSATGAITSL